MAKSKTLASGKKVIAGSKADPESNRFVAPKLSETPPTTQPKVGAPPATTQSYQYVKNDGSIGSTSGMNTDEAMAGAADRAPTSGLIRLGTETASPITSSSGTEREEEKKTGTKVTRLSAPDYNSPANNTKYLDDFERTLTSMAGGEASNINTQFDQLNQKTIGEQQKEVGTTSAGLARMGGYLGESGSGTGVMLSLVRNHRAELAELESKRQEALFTARKFYAEKKFDLAKEKAQEAEDREQEIYERQQEFFQNQRSVNADDRTVANQERDDARSVLTNIVSNANGQAYDDLDEETRRTIESSATKAGYPLGVIKSMLEKPKGLATKLDSLIKDAAKKGAPSSILAAIAESGSFAEAAAIASPYLAKSGSDTPDDGPTTKFTPTALKGVVASQGTNLTLEQLISETPPAWFGPIANEVARTEFAALGLASAPDGGVDPQGSIAQGIWSSFRTRPDIQLFVQELRKKIIGTPKDPESSGYGYAVVTPSDDSIDE